jgi:hypothetical protein
VSLTIWKYAVPAEDEFTVTMPKCAQILDVQDQNGQPCLWALVNPEAETEPRHFFLRGTGHPMGEAATGVYVGTFQVAPGPLVFHLFDFGTPATP